MIRNVCLRVTAVTIAAILMQSCAQSEAQQNSSAADSDNDHTQGVKAPVPASVTKAVNEVAQWHASYQSWHKIMNRRRSPLHWNQFIVSYAKTKEFAETYGQNHQIEKLELAGADELEIEEAGGYRAYPVGGLIVKENLTRSREKGWVMDSITYMKKLKEGEWRYVQTDADGKVTLDSLTQPKLADQKCNQCHANVKNRDYLFHTYFDYEEK